MAWPQRPRPSISLSTVATVGTAVTVALHGVILVGFGLLAAYMVPRFKEMFADMRVELPPATMLLIVVTDCFRNYWYLLAPGALAVLVVDALVFWLLARRRATWPLSMLWFLVATIVVGGGGLVWTVIALFLPLVTVMENVGQG